MQILRMVTLVGLRKKKQISFHTYNMLNFWTNQHFHAIKVLFYLFSVHFLLV